MSIIFLYSSNMWKPCYFPLHGRNDLRQVALILSYRCWFYRSGKFLFVFKDLCRWAKLSSLSSSVYCINHFAFENWMRQTLDSTQNCFTMQSRYNELTWLQVLSDVRYIRASRVQCFIRDRIFFRLKIAHITTVITSFGAMISVINRCFSSLKECMNYPQRGTKFSCKMSRISGRVPLLLLRSLYPGKFAIGIKLLFRL